MKTGPLRLQGTLRQFFLAAGDSVPPGVRRLGLRLGQAIDELFQSRQNLTVQRFSQRLLDGRTRG